MKSGGKPSWARSLKVNVGDCQNPRSQWINNLFILSREPVFNLHGFHCFCNVLAGPKVYFLFFKPVGDFFPVRFMFILGGVQLKMGKIRITLRSLK